MSDDRQRGGLRIGELAARTGATTRTIRYYEELGLLPGDDERPSGGHRLYGEEDVERVKEVLRLKQLLGISLEELRELLAAEQARALLRSEWHAGGTPPARQAEILREALRLVERQLELVHHRRAEIDRLEAELAGRRERILGRLAELAAPARAD